MSGGPAPESAPMTRFERSGTVASGSTGVEVTSAGSVVGAFVPPGAVPRGAAEAGGRGPAGAVRWGGVGSGRCDTLRVPDRGTGGVASPEVVGSGVAAQAGAVRLAGGGLSRTWRGHPSPVGRLVPVRGTAAARLVT